ncbi:MAG: hypothetical protein ABR552_07325 [Actinomycetota bacterium]
MRFPPHHDPGYFGPGYGPWHAVLLFMLLAAFVAGDALLVIFLARRAGSTTMLTTHHPAAIDPAIQQLRMRYARGDISRDDYLSAARDLGDPAAPPPPPAAPE